MIPGTNAATRALIGLAVVCGLLTLAIPSKSEDRALQGPASARWLFDEEERTVEPLSETSQLRPFVLELELEKTCYVYVASFDFTRGHIALWPSSQLRAERTQNPLPAGTHRLPGRDDERKIRWHTGDAPGSIDHFLIVSEHPLKDLERFLRSCRQLGNRAFPSDRMLDLYAPEGGMKVTPTRTRLDQALLIACRRVGTEEHDGKLHPIPGFEGVYGATLRLRNPVEKGAMPTRDEIQERLGAAQMPAPEFDPNDLVPGGRGR